MVNEVRVPIAQTNGQWVHILIHHAVADVPELNYSELPKPLVFLMRGQEMSTRSRIFEHLDSIMSFPDWWGRNWDALFSILVETLRDKRQPIILAIDHAEAIGNADTEEVTTKFVDILHDVGEALSEPYQESWEHTYAPQPCHSVLIVDSDHYAELVNRLTSVDYDVLK
jgi:RNAse (barnase) inhibitor barstar